MVVLAEMKARILIIFLSTPRASRRHLKVCFDGSDVGVYLSRRLQRSYVRHQGIWRLSIQRIWGIAKSIPKYSIYGLKHIQSHEDQEQGPQQSKKKCESNKRGD